MHPWGWAVLRCQLIWLPEGTDIQHLFPSTPRTFDATQDGGCPCAYRSAALGEERAFDRDANIVSIGGTRQPLQAIGVRLCPLDRIHFEEAFHPFLFLFGRIELVTLLRAMPVPRLLQKLVEYEFGSDVQEPRSHAQGT